MPIFATDRILMRTSCDRPALSSNPLRLSARIFYCAFVSVFSFLHYFPAIRPPFPTRETRKYGYRCRLLAVGFSPYFAITRQMDLCSEFHRMGITAAFRTYCVLSKSARKQLFFILPLRLRYSLRFDFLRPCDRSLRAVLLDSVFASEKCANACGAREHPPSTQTPAQPSFSRRCCDIAGSVYGPRLSDIRRRVR